MSGQAQTWENAEHLGYVVVFADEPGGKVNGFGDATIIELPRGAPEAPRARGQGLQRPAHRDRAGHRPMSRVVAWSGPPTPFVPSGNVALYVVNGPAKDVGNLFAPKDSDVRRRVVVDADGNFATVPP